MVAGIHRVVVEIIPMNDHSWPSDDSSSGEDDDVRVSRVPRSRIKLQKFDGSESWESWWAHFQNCASYNRWSERDKLAFMKEALTANAAQVLWDLSRKLVYSLRSRYSGERQAEKYRVELQIRRRKCAESLSDLHQDIRKLMALAYPKLTAGALEEIAFDYFTNALYDAEFALKVKERAPVSLDEALRIALRLEAWQKSTYMPKNDEDRIERPRQIIRTTGKQPEPKAPEFVEHSDQIKQLKTDMSKMSADVNGQYEELKKLIVGNTPQPRVMGNPVQSSTVSHGPSVAPPPFRSFDNRRFASTGENAMMSGRPPQMNQSPGYLVCWDCGIPGHVRRDCPGRSRAPPIQQSQGNTANRHSKKIQDKARVYIK